MSMAVEKTPTPNANSIVVEAQTTSSSSVSRCADECSCHAVTDYAVFVITMALAGPGLRGYYCRYSE